MISIVAIAIGITAIVIVATTFTAESSGMSKHNIMEINHGFKKIASIHQGIYWSPV